MKRSISFLTSVVITGFLLVSAAYSGALPILSEIRNEQPNSVDNNAIRIRLFNQGTDGYQKLSFCYKFHASKKFIFESNWYLPGLDHTIDTLSDTTFQIHFRLKEGVSFAKNTFFPNESGIVFGLHHEDWSAWNHDLDYSYSSSPTFVRTDRLFVSNDDHCIDGTGNVSSSVLGSDNDKNGVRDDMDSLINQRFPSDPTKRASYRFVAKSIQSQWIVFNENAQVSYEELLPYSVYVAQGLDFIKESGAVNDLPYREFIRHYINTTARVQFEDKISDVFVGKELPVYVKRNKKYEKYIAIGLSDYQKILQLERGAN